MPQTALPLQEIATCEMSGNARTFMIPTGALQGVRGSNTHHLEKSSRESAKTPNALEHELPMTENMKTSHLLVENGQPCVAVQNIKLSTCLCPTMRGSECQLPPSTSISHRHCPECQQTCHILCGHCLESTGNRQDKGGLTTGAKHRAASKRAMLTCACKPGLAWGSDIRLAPGRNVAAQTMTPTVLSMCRQVSFNPWLFCSTPSEFLPCLLLFNKILLHDIGVNTARVGDVTPFHPTTSRVLDWKRRAYISLSYTS